jgi:hypothetical protein
MRLTMALVIVGVVVLAANAPAQTPSPSTDTRSDVELIGCVSPDPGASGAFTFSDSTSGGKYKLTGKSVRKYAGRMVRLVPGQKGKLSIRGGLWPSPNIAGQAGAIDTAEASIARQPGGAASGTGGNDLPEIRVVSVRGVEGRCR